ncbi:hypothetical protein Hanom_Chr09g00794671 [Helianthus anomalus]
MDKTRKHNQPCKIQLPPKEFEDVINWINSSKISYAIQADPTIYTIHIEEFLKNTKVETVNKVKRITTTVRNKEVIVKEDSVRRVLSLGDNHQDPLRLKKDEILDGFKGMEYIKDFHYKN